MITTSKTMTSTFPYQIEEAIGSGGMGIVYRAFEPALNRRVAIKVLRPQSELHDNVEIAEEFRKRFTQEARAAAALSHPGATTIYRVGEEDGVPYIAMEWLDGKTLESVLLQEGKLPVERVARIAVELLDALGAAHRAGIVHRDIKPANLIILKDGRLKITDFGIARVQDSDLVKTGAGLILATPQYASPEQLQAGDIDGRSDLFSTSVLLYNALSGRYPYEGKTLFDLMAALARSQPVPLSKHLPDVPPALEAAIMRGLAKSPDGRFATTADMAAAFVPFLSTGSLAVSGALTQNFDPLEPAETIRDTPDASYPSFTNLPENQQQAIVRVVESWPARNLGVVKTASLLARLLERPLHAAPFAGGVFIGSYCVLIWNGFIVGAVDFNWRTSDEVCEELPEEAVVILHPVPDEFPVNLIPLLACLLHQPRVRYADLDSSIVNLPNLAKKLHEEKFDGLLRLRRGTALGFIFFDKGVAALSMFSVGWDDLPINQTWESWVSSAPINASIEEKVWIPAHLSYRRELHNFGLTVEPPKAKDSGGLIAKTLFKQTGSLRTLRQLKGDSGASGKPETSTIITPVASFASNEEATAMQAFLAGDPTYRFLEWAVEELPAFFSERDRSSRWKYLCEWIPLIRKSVLHYDLPRPDSRLTDFFDLVTLDESEKVLHIGHRVPRGTPEALETFVSRVVEAKKARTKTGDVGGAFLIAPSFDESMIEAYKSATKPVGTGLLSVEERLTKYEGFIRLGPRRGFHLLLVVEKATGFDPVLLV